MLNKIKNDNGDSDSPCQSCGACCAYFRVSFHWIETSESNERFVPVVLTESLGSNMVCMSGTNQKTPRCSCLTGNIGEDVGCSIYKDRSTSCQELQAGEDKCNKARAHYGLALIS